MKRMMWSTIVLLVCALLGGCKEQSSDLVSVADKIKSITVYDLEGLTGPKYTDQDLKNAFQAYFNTKLFQQLAPVAKFRNERVMWKGSRLAVVKLIDGSEKQLALSYYGGFFKILGEDGVFYFEGEALNKWEEAFSKTIVQDNFIPKRIIRSKQQTDIKP